MHIFFYFALIKIPIKCYNHRLKSTQGVHTSVPITCHSHRSQLTQRDVYASYFSLINKDTNQAATFIISSLQGKCLGSLFHYTQHSDEVDPEYLDCDIKLTIYKTCKNIYIQLHVIAKRPSTFKIDDALQNLNISIYNIWASSWDYGSYHIGDQRRLRWACASAQSRQSLHCLHTWSMEVDEGSNKKSDIWPQWMACTFEKWVYGGQKVP